MSEQAQPIEGQDPPAPVAPQLSDSPWKTKLEAAFTDPAEAARVDQFMREGYQPYVTKLEQDNKDLGDKAFVYDALETDAEGSFKQMAEELFGEDVAAAVATALEGTEAAVNEETTIEEAVTALPKEAQEALEWVAQKRQEDATSQATREYLEDLEGVIAKNPEIDKDLFHPFVVTAEGDFDKAVASYNVWAKKAGLVKKEDPDPPPPVPGETPGVPATVKQGQSLDAAVDEFFADVNKVPAPPTV